MSKEATMSVVESQEETTMTKDQIEAKIARLEEKNETLIKEMQERDYEVDFKSKKVFDRLVKFLEKDAPWGHTTATGLIMLYHNIREQKEVTKDKEWNGIINIRSASVTILWQMVTKMTGSGFYEAKTFVELMANIGETLSTAVQAVNDDNQELRETHMELAKLQQELDKISVEGPATK